MIRIIAMLAALVLIQTVLTVPGYCANESKAAPASEDPAALNAEAVRLYQAGRYADAIPLAERVLALREKGLGPEHPDVAGSLHNLARLYKSMGDYAKSEPLYQRSLAIREKALGPEHPDVAISLNNLALLYKSMGDYAKAEPLYQRSLAIREKALGPEHPDVAISLNNQALLYTSMGDYAKAEPLYQRSLAIREKALGAEHPDVAASLNNLAELYRTMGTYAKAAPLYQRSLAIWEKALGAEHPDVATSLNNLAGLYKSMGDYAKAEPLYQRSLAILEKAVGAKHSNVASSLNNLAGLYITKGAYAKAEPLCQRSLAIREKALGPEHPHVAMSLITLSVVLAARADYRQAFTLQRRAQDIDQGMIDQVMGFTSEGQKLEFLAKLRGNLYTFLSLVALHLRDDAQVARSAFDVWLRRKGAALEAQKLFQEALVLSGDPKGQEVFKQLAQLRAERSKLVYAGPGKAGPESYRAQMDALQKTISEKEAELSRLSQAYARDRKRAAVDAAQAAAALPKGAALVEMAKIDLFDFKAIVTENKWLPAHYLAFVLPAGAPERLAFLDLGEAAPIDAAVVAFKRATEGDSNPVAAAQAARTLHNLVFAPLTASFDGAKDIFLSPDGDLNLIPFEVLLDFQNRRLIETYTFNYLASGRDLIGMGEMASAKGPAIVVGDPDFDLDPKKQATAKKPKAAAIESPRVFQRSVNLRDIHFNPLPWTRTEAEAVRKQLGGDTTIYLGAAAVESALRAKLPPRVLHLATHGFFLGDQDIKLVHDSRSFAITQKEGEPNAPSSNKVEYEDPLRRSGIALAGANASLRGTGSEGIITAENILTLPLNGTELVTLSACQTGQGEVKTGEGVFGLRRSITQAGAKGLVMSMWSVPDKETKELMVSFYENVFSKGMGKAQALRQAALKEREIAKKRHGEDNPHYWGAFIYMGER